MSTNGDYYHRCSVFISMILIFIYFFLQEESELEEENGKKYKPSKILFSCSLLSILSHPQVYQITLTKPKGNENSLRT